ncbi:MAG: YkgJ family cysteine cluster protein [Myxococcales bacterium]|nr:YkgJ family cysteine cluster protein [Myxococcales bacterium]
MTASSALCTKCGLCCDGTFLDRAPLEAGELDWATKHRLPLLSRGETTGFTLPCVLLKERQCSSYETRPAVCRAYQCELLKGVLAGAVALADAERLVATVQGLAAQVRAEGLLDKAEAIFGPKTAERSAQASVDWLLNLGGLKSLVDRHFRRPEPTESAREPSG